MVLERGKEPQFFANREDPKEDPSWDPLWILLRILSARSRVDECAHQSSPLKNRSSHTWKKWCVKSQGNRLGWHRRGMSWNCWNIPHIDSFFSSDSHCLFLKSVEDDVCRISIRWHDWHLVSGFKKTNICVHGSHSRKMGAGQLCGLHWGSLLSPEKVKTSQQAVWGCQFKIMRWKINQIPWTWTGCSLAEVRLNQLIVMVECTVTCSWGIGALHLAHANLTCTSLSQWAMSMATVLIQIWSLQK